MRFPGYLIPGCTVVGITPSNQAIAVSDLAIILAQDPFANPNSVPSITSINNAIGLDGVNPSNRYTFVTALPYETANNASYANSYTSTTTNSSNAVTRYSMTSTISAGVNCLLSAGFTLTDTVTCTQSTQKTSSNGNTYTTTASIQDPASTWNGDYSQTFVYIDNIYGAYLFVPPGGE